MNNCESKYTCYRIIILEYVHDIKASTYFTSHERITTFMKMIAILQYIIAYSSLFVNTKKLWKAKKLRKNFRKRENKIIKMYVLK